MSNTSLDWHVSLIACMHVYERKNNLYKNGFMAGTI